MIKKIIIDSKATGGSNPINAIAFPDAGAHKRFGGLFKDLIEEDHVIICSKIRDGGTTKVTIADGNAIGKHVLIVDDQTKSGKTLYECAKELKTDDTKGGATHVSAYVTHFVPIESAKDEIEKLGTEGENKGIFSIFKHFYYTNSVPDTTNIHTKHSGKFQQLPLAKLVLDNL